ncbi:enoyl-CoA hydratase/isomerase family protein, partial [Klebsiella pneumoniae]|uniref:enoyl-CoA hydratase/isomerase family protein n=2 Tax=Enterobacteriaceae TaxID=543 RepID=UPI0013D37F1A
LSADVLEEFDSVLAAIEKDRPRGLVIRSAKRSGFIAGADVNAFRGATDPRQVEAEIARAHRVTDRLANIGMPTIAVIHGFCLGGGVTMLYSTDIRVASEHATFNLAEVKRGIIAGNGGTQRT